MNDSISPNESLKDQVRHIYETTLTTTRDISTQFNISRATLDRWKIQGQWKRNSPAAKPTTLPASIWNLISASGPVTDAKLDFLLSQNIVQKRVDLESQEEAIAGQLSQYALKALQSGDREKAKVAVDCARVLEIATNMRRRSLGMSSGICYRLPDDRKK